MAAAGRPTTHKSKQRQARPRKPARRKAGGKMPPARQATTRKAPAARAARPAAPRRARPGRTVALPPRSSARRASAGLRADCAPAAPPAPRPLVTRPVTKEELLAKAKKPAADALVLHPFYKGKYEIVPKCCIRDLNDFAIWYTPGVAAACMDIFQRPEQVREHTNVANTIAVVSDGSRVLGLGNIGPQAGLPVMEGKAILFKYLGGVDAIPLVVGCHQPEEIIQLVRWIAPSVGGINLEDIASPKCFAVLDTLRDSCGIPVWHDDQQGTAAVTLAALFNALKLVGKRLDQVRIALLGAGAANLCIVRMLGVAGADLRQLYLVDTKGILHKGRLDVTRESNPEKFRWLHETNAEQRQGGIAEAMAGADVLIALSQPGPDTVKPEWIKGMARDAIVFVCANPIPEIWPWEAKEAGARIVATGRSDFANQVNNSLGFPGIFRGTLDVMATTITDEMCIEAARELARTAEDRGLDADYLIPTMDDWEVFPRVAAAVGMQAIAQKVARRALTRDELFATAEATICRARKQVELAMEQGIIAKPPRT